jgi:hypothetical protein
MWPHAITDNNKNFKIKVYFKSIMDPFNQTSTCLDESKLDSIILNRVFDEAANKNVFVKKKQPDNPVIDSRFQAYLKFYIAELLESDTSRYDSCETSSKRGVLQINNCFVCRVSICGNIVSIYESAKFYRYEFSFMPHLESSWGIFF